MRKKFVLNICINFLYQVLNLIYGFIIPRQILLHYGSDVNGLVQSVTQFLGVISLLECGMSAVADANLYVPLAKNDKDAVSRIFISTEKFFRRIAVVFAGYIAVLAVLYPVFVRNEFGHAYTCGLILIISAGMFLQYYFGISYIILLNADQRGYAVKLMQSITLAVNTVITVALMQCGVSIHLVKLISPVVFLIQPIGFQLYADRHYHLNRNIVLNGEPLKQKWNGLAQHIAFEVNVRADTIILTCFSQLKNVSVYGVYNMIHTGAVNCFQVFNFGTSPVIGRLLANGEKEKLNQFFAVYEWMCHAAVTLLFTMTGILLIPFVKVYTYGITDADYIQPAFAAVITIANAVRLLRTPYNTLVSAACHFKETQASSVIEALINIAVSVAMVSRFGLAGVAAGTLAAMAYRTVYLAWYVSGHIIYRKFTFFIKNLMTDLMTCLCMLGLSGMICTDLPLSYAAWTVLAVKEGVLCLSVSICFNLLFHREETGIFIKLLKGRQD